MGLLRSYQSCPLDDGAGHPGPRTPGHIAIKWRTNREMALPKRTETVYLPAPMLAKTRAEVTPMNPKNGADVGQFSVVISVESMVVFGEGGRSGEVQSGDV